MPTTGLKPAPTTLVDTDPASKDRRPATAHRGPHRVLDRRSKAHCLVTHPAGTDAPLTHCPSSPPRKRLHSSYTPGTVPKRIKTSIQAGEEGCHQNRTAEQLWARDATTTERRADLCCRLLSLAPDRGTGTGLCAVPSLPPVSRRGPVLGAANTMVCSSGLKEAGDIVSCRASLRKNSGWVTRGNLKPRE